MVSILRTRRARSTARGPARHSLSWKPSLVKATLSQAAERVAVASQVKGQGTPCTGHRALSTRPQAPPASLPRWAMVNPPRSVAKPTLQQDAVLGASARGGGVGTCLLQALTSQVQVPLLTETPLHPQAQAACRLAQAEGAVG